MTKGSSKRAAAAAAAAAADDDKSIDSSTPPLAQAVERKESVVDVARKAKRKHASRGSNKQRPVNFMPDIIRMYRSRVMDDVREDCALKSNASAFLNEFASHRLRVLKSNTDRTIASRKHDTLSVPDVIAHVKLSTYADKHTQDRAIRFVKKAVAAYEASVEKDEHEKYLRDKAEGKDVKPRDKRSRSEKAKDKKKNKKKKQQQKDESDGVAPMDEGEDSEQGNESPDSDEEDDVDAAAGTDTGSPDPSSSADEEDEEAFEDRVTREEQDSE
jgi:hypothetical protein